MLFITLLLSLFSLTSAWGSLGHRTVAYLAQLHFTPQAATWVNTLLAGEDISQAAIYPDIIAQLPQYKYTKPWHYIDAQDDPPHTCFLNFTRDCLDTCIVTALVNQTSRVKDNSLSLLDQGIALKFLMHFVGDIHQPLHTEKLGYGGNTVYVVFDGNATNLHATWDYAIPNKHAGLGVNRELEAARAWASRLYYSEHLSECVGDMKDCSLEWAAEANTYVCSYVLKDGATGLPADLGTDYYQGSIGIVDRQIQRAGRRLAAWINSLAPSYTQEEL